MFMYCKNCGNQVDDRAVICTQCGCLTDFGEKLNFNQNPQQHEERPTTTQVQQSNQTNTASSNEDTLGLVAKILMIVSTVLTGLYIIPLAWMLPMTLSLSNKLNNKEPISVGFKICILLFGNTIAGILLLCRKDENN